MKALKTLPISYFGELHDVQLCNFSVELDEVQPLLPPPLRPQIKQGRALISLVNVRLRHMRPAFGGKILRFNYRHIGFRLLLEDSAYNATDHHKGIFFLQSITDRPFIAWGGRIFTNFRLQKGQIKADHTGLDLQWKDRYLHYATPTEAKFEHPDLPQLLERVGRIDRAYAVMDGQPYVTQVIRKHWPLEAIPCTGFRTNFFETARFEACFRVPEVIHYQWKAPQITNA